MNVPHASSRANRCNPVSDSYLWLATDLHLVASIADSLHLLRERLQTVAGDKPSGSNIVLGEKFEQPRYANFASKYALQPSQQRKHKADKNTLEKYPTGCLHLHTSQAFKKSARGLTS